MCERSLTIASPTAVTIRANRLRGCIMIVRTGVRGLVLVTRCLLLAVAGATAQAASGPKRGATYTGKAGGETVSFTVSGNGKKVLNFTTRLGYNGKCGQGGGPTFSVRAASLTLARSGRFKGSTTGTFPGGHFAPVQIAIKGTIRGKQASGTVEEPAALHCTEGPNK